MFKSSLTKVPILFIVSVLLFLVSACKKEAEPATDQAGGMPADLKDMVFEEIPGSHIQYARQLDSMGRVQIEGFVDGTLKTGQWIQYNTDGEILLINHYVNGMLEGVAMRMTFRNQVDLKLNYRQNQLHGPWIAYKFGKVVEQRNYKDGKLEGTVRLYDERTFKLKQESQYRNGLLDGYFKHYDEEGNVTLEYQYKNGEKVSGGIVEPNK